MTARVQNNGLANIVSALVSANVMKWLQWGTGSGAVASANVVTTAAAEARTSGTLSAVTTTVTNDTLQCVGTITCAGSGKTISEVGVMDASTSGNLDVYFDFTGVALLVGDSIAFTTQVKFV
jgi:glycine betaine/choline ABC-type transport system substrate-binding protein